MLIASLCVCLLSTFQAEAPNAAEFGRLVRQAHDPIRDFDFIFEGEEWRFVEGQRHRELWFQGGYAHAQNGDSHLELYAHDFSQGTDILTRNRYALLGHELYERYERSDRPSDAKGLPLRTSGGPGVLARPMSPEQMFCFFWFFDAFREPGDQGYKALGFEEVDGRRCLMVRIDIAPFLDGDRVPHYVFWIDTERGWHPIRVENRGADNEVRWRVPLIQLSEVALPDGSSVWFPTRGSIEYFSTPKAGGPGRAVRFAEAAIVVNTLRINQDFPRERFEIDYERNPAHEKLADAKRELQQAQAAARPELPAIDTSPEGTRQRVNEMIAAAEARGNLIEATPPSARFWTSTRLFQLVLTAVGLFALFFLYLLMKRR